MKYRCLLSDSEEEIFRLYGKVESTVATVRCVERKWYESDVQVTVRRDKLTFR